MKKILLINGPNLQLLGKREPAIYGYTTLQEIVEVLEKRAAELGYLLEDFQSNSEGDLVSYIGAALEREDVAGIIINPAAYTHTSVAIRDAIAAVHKPTVEVHLSNVNGREEFRSHSYTAPVCSGVIAGFGDYGYTLALFALDNILQQ